MFTYSLSGLAITSTGDVPTEVEESETTARSAVYQVLASFFGPADPEHYAKAAGGTWAEELAKAATLLPFSIDADPAGLSPGVPEGGYAAERSRIFSDQGDHDRLLREAGSASDPDTLLAQVRREYDYFGLAASEEAARPPDHLVTECDFMQYLCFREAATSSDRLRSSYRRAQRDFLDRHLGPWIPNLVASVSEREPQAPFPWGIERLDAFIRADHAYVASLLAP